MGCVHGKCVSRHPSSTDSNSGGSGEMGSYRNATSKRILTQRSLEIVPVPSRNYDLQYSVLTQRGYYPDSPDKENQDSFCIRTQVQGNPNIHFFGVFDGHGHFGTECSKFVKDRLVEILAYDPTLLADPVKAYNSAFSTANNELHSSEIDDSMSGTTAITVLVIGDTIYVANVGDSRAVIAVKNGNRIVAEDLSSDQTPFRKDEYERVKLSGARILTFDQVEGLKDPDIQVWGDEESQGGDPPRLWVQNGMYPGTAFSRSVGDSTAEKNRCYFCSRGVYGLALLQIICSLLLQVMEFLSSSQAKLLSIWWQDAQIPEMLVLPLLGSHTKYGWNMKAGQMILQSLLFTLRACLMCWRYRWNHWRKWEPCKFKDRKRGSSDWIRN
ncbi:hypothetical protein OIU77_011276 [Salix suchowensis]|uniref:protein-serine/threonine phosphatase n=1 Tax=Salix suchowensis TaxID=1278906 RepID=A0ABQ8ZZL4_9ROSI|nr:hypothetical protein OIU77_011276 [Salix suchowensis]